MPWIQLLLLGIKSISRKVCFILEVMAVVNMDYTRYYSYATCGGNARIWREAEALGSLKHKTLRAAVASLDNPMHYRLESNGTIITVIYCTCNIEYFWLALIGFSWWGTNTRLDRHLDRVSRPVFHYVTVLIFIMAVISLRYLGEVNSFWNSIKFRIQATPNKQADGQRVFKMYSRVCWIYVSGTSGQPKNDLQKPASSHHRLLNCFIFSHEGRNFCSYFVPAETQSSGPF